MALPDSVKKVVGTTIILGNAAAHNGSVAAANNLGNVTDEIDCSDLVAQNARQSAKFDFGANLDVEYVLAACVEWETTPEIAAGETLKFYIAWSHSATAANANPGGVSGSDSAYTGYSAGSLAASLKQLDLIGSMSQDNVINSDQAQIDTRISTFTPGKRYGTLVVFNAAASAALHSDMVETSFSIAPLVIQLQD